MKNEPITNSGGFTRPADVLPLKEIGAEAYVYGSREKMASPKEEFLQASFS